MRRSRIHPLAARRRAPRWLLVAAAFLAAGLPTAGAAAPIDAAALAADLRSMAANAAEVHPALADPTAREAFLAHAKAVEAHAGDARDEGDAAVLAAELLRPLADAHSTVSLAAAASARLPVSFRWAVDGLVVSPLNGFGEQLPAVARVRTLGGMKPPAVLARLGQLLPGNDAWLRRSAAPALTLAPVLRWLGAVDADGAVTIVVTTEAGPLSLRLHPVPAARLAGRTAPLRASLQRAVGLTREDWQRGATYLWRVDPATSTATFWLLACVDSRDYRASVQAFFEAAARQGAKRMVIDLRFNGGGDSRVMDPLLAHLPPGRGLRYGVSVRASDAAARLRGLTRAALTLQAVGRDANGLYLLSRPGSPRATLRAAAPVYRGPVYVVTGPGTFSSAGMLAVTLHDNGLATVIGEPTGAEPSGYGDILRFRTPHLGITYTLSFKAFTRPDPTSRGASLEPAVPLPVTVDDLLQGRDPVTAWLSAPHD